MRVAVLSPYHGGSHAAWAQGWQRHSRLDVSLLTLPARFWKWRMHGGALTLARDYLDGHLDAGGADRLVATDMVDLSTFLALTRRVTGDTPALLYMHENQLTYPLPTDPATGAMRRQRGERDHHYGFVNLASMLAADGVAFNSAYHRDSLLAALPPFLRRFPEPSEERGIDAVRARSFVLYPGIEVDDIGAPDGPREAPPLIVWNQRWEYDKNPAELAEALLALAATGEPFRVALCGEQFGRRPPELERLVDGLGARLVHVGFLARADYVRLLGEAALVISTALHEFFGIAVLEAVAAGALPLLPRRLSYPELIPESLHDDLLYDEDAELPERMRALLNDERSRARAIDLALLVRERHAWARRAPEYDRRVAALGR